MKTLGLPLKIHEDISAFKLYLLDCGLLGAMSKTPPALLLLPSYNNTGKGDFTENFVCCQLESLRQIPIYYYSKENSQLIMVLSISQRYLETVRIRRQMPIKEKEMYLYFRDFSYSGFQESFPPDET